jgi:hypothetical protein
MEVRRGAAMSNLFRNSPMFDSVEIIKDAPVKVLCTVPNCQDSACRRSHELTDGALRWCEQCGGYLEPQSDLTPIHARCSCAKHLEKCSEESGCDFGCPLSEAPDYQERETGHERWRRLSAI